jgi:hypothetical protein
MSTATRSTGPRKRSSQNTPAEIRLVPLARCKTHRPAAPKPHVTSQLQCYIPALTDNDRRSHAKINRQPRRLELTVSHTKQTSAPQINRQQIATSRIVQFASPLPSRDTQHARSNPQFLQVSASHQCRIAATDRLAPVAGNSVSNRQWQILEFAETSIKTPLFGVLIGTKARLQAPRKRPISRVGTSSDLCGSRRSADADLRSFRLGCRTAPGR